MKILSTIAFVVLTASIFAQIEKTTLNGKTYFVYPFQQGINSQEEIYMSYYDQREVLKRDDKNQKVVAVTLEKVDKSDVPDYMIDVPRKYRKYNKQFIDLFEKYPGMFASINSDINEEITPALESLPDGEYVQYFRDVPFIKDRVLRFRNDLVSGIFTIKNNVLVGESQWFDLSGKIRRIGTYANGNKTGTWMQYQYQERLFDTLTNYNPNASVEEQLKAMTFDTLSVEMHFKNGVRDGAYFKRRNAVVFESGFYTNDLASGNWNFYGYKQVQKVYEKNMTYAKKGDVYFENTDELILLENYTYRSDEKRGKSILIRDVMIPERYRYQDIYIPEFDEDKKSETPKFNFEDPFSVSNSFDYEMAYFDMDDSTFPNFNELYQFFKDTTEQIELSEEQFSSYEGEEYYNPEEDYLFPTDNYNPAERYIQVGRKNYTVNDLIDSIGYLFAYEGVFERYYNNGQLQVKYEITDGQLQAETPVYWSNGKVANEIVWVADSNFYVQRFYDYNGKLFSEIEYDKKGNVRTTDEELETKVMVVNGKKYNFEYGIPTYDFYASDSLRKGITEKQVVIDRLWKVNQQSAAQGIFDPTTHTLVYTESTFSNKPFSAEETVFADDYKSLTSTQTKRYKNLEVKTIKSGTFTPYWFENESDSVSDQLRVIGWNYKYELDYDKQLLVNYTPFTGTLNYKVNASSFKVNATNKSISIVEPMSSSDQKMYHKMIPAFLKTGKTNDYIDAYTPDFNYSPQISGLLRGFFILTPSVFDGGSNYPNYFLDTAYTNKRKGTPYDDEYINYQYRLSKKILRNTTLAGTYLNGKPTGTWQVKDQKGNVRMEVNFKEGMYDGTLKNYAFAYPPEKKKKPKKGSEEENYDYEESYETVSTREELPKKKTYYLANFANYKNDRLNGPSYQFNWQGDTIGYTYFVDGARNGKSFKRNKLFYSESYYEDGFEDGITRTYLIKSPTDSILLFELNFQSGALQGESKSYHTNGKIAKKGFFLTGQPIDDYEAFDTLGVRYQYVKFQYSQPVEEKIWEENQLSVRYIFDWKDSIPFFLEDITSATSIDRLLYSMGFDDEARYMPYYGRPSLVDKAGINYRMTKYYPNDTIAREGQIMKGKKTGNWSYFNYNGQKLMTVNYFDTVLVINDSVKFKSKGILTYLDANQNELSKSWIIEKFEKYDCSHTDHNEERMLYCFWEKDTTQQRMNGYVKNYYDNGSIQNEGMVKDGLPTGIWKMYDVDGHLSHVGEYLLGKRTGRWLKGDLGSVKNMSEICLNPNIENLDEILKYQEKLLDITVIYYQMGKEISKLYFGVNMNNEDAPEGYYPEGDYYEEGY